MIKVLGIKIIDRIKEAGLTQEILSRHAKVITTRLGFHEVTDEVCSREAYIILHLSADPSDTEVLKSELKDLGGIELREMIFTNQKETLNAESSTSSVEILGLLVERSHDVIISVQKLLTSYGCNIRTRLGVNEIFFGEPAGLIILELKGDEKQRLLLEKDLKALKKVHVRTMVF
jgi:DNA-binding transcriptional ArsR family regulator